MSDLNFIQQAAPALKERLIPAYLSAIHYVFGECNPITLPSIRVISDDHRNGSHLCSLMFLHRPHFKRETIEETMNHGQAAGENFTWNGKQDFENSFVFYIIMDP